MSTSTEPLYLSDEESKELPVSARIRSRLLRARQRYHANDNISAYMMQGEVDALAQFAQRDDLAVHHGDDAVDERDALGVRRTGDPREGEGEGEEPGTHHQNTCSKGSRGRRLGGTSARSSGLVGE